MNKPKQEAVLRDAWKKLYADKNVDLLNSFINELDSYKSLQKETAEKLPDWYRDAVIYSLYVDLFNKDFKGLEEKLDYLQDLGVNCLWLLPILDSPMKDAGFDIRNYRSIRKDLAGLKPDADEKEVNNALINFIGEAHKRGIRVIFDIALNHTSEEHEWFIKSKSEVGSQKSEFRDYYIWNKDDKKYKETRLLFKGMCPSNWEKSGDWYFFHRFFEFQPDLNYQNPKVLIEMCRNLLYWSAYGVDGFRADAIPYIWKEDGTNCENLENTHVIVKFFRAVLDHVRPDAFMLAEACQPPIEVVKYFGNEDECHAGYHFPIMPQIYISIAQQDRKPLLNTLKQDITPSIPDSCQWFIFLRLHDELTLEMVTQEERDIINNYYRRDIRWNFREGEGISARLADLMEYDPQKIGMAYSVMLTMLGTPVVYYGDEFGKKNDEDYYREMTKMTGKDDTRFFVRGKIDWEKTMTELKDPDSFASKINKIVKLQLKTRNKYKCFGRGSREWVAVNDQDGKINDKILAYIRNYKEEKVLVINNLSDKEQIIKVPFNNKDIKKDILGSKINIENGNMILKGYGYYWIEI